MSENLPLLPNTDRAGLPDLFDQKKHIVYPAGGSAFSSSDTLKNVYFILSGKIKISQVNPETSKEQTLYLLSRGGHL
jgi:CRP-like cAMP-binding protein